MSYNKKLIIIGGNSRLSKIILSNNDIRSLYQSCVIFVSRPFNYNDLLNIDDEIILYNSQDKPFSEIFNNFFKTTPNLSISFDVIFTGTPTDGFLYNDKVILANTIELIGSEKPPKTNIICTIYILGSILVFIPIFGNKNYKNIKILEYNTFLLNEKLFSNICYLVLPPIGNVNSKLGNFFSTAEDDFGVEIFNLLANNYEFTRLKFMGKWYSKILLKLSHYFHSLLK